LYGGVSTTQGVVDPGGIQNDLTVWDLDQKVWAPLANGLARQGHASCYMAKLNSIVTFGGGDQNAQAFNAILVYNITSGTWNVNPQVMAAGSTPGARVFHTAVCLNDSMIVFGGGNYAAGTVSPVYNDVWVLQAAGESFAWRRPKITGEENAPMARMGHSAELYDNGMYVYGGMGVGGDSTVYILDVNTWTWSKMINQVSGGREVDYKMRIILGVSAGLVGLAVLVALVYCFCRRKKSKLTRRFSQMSTTLCPTDLLSVEHVPCNQIASLPLPTKVK
jgi:hypothetical protein